MPYTERLGALAQRLFDIGAVKFGEFYLKLHETQPDAPLSPIYLNLRTPDNKGGSLDAEIVREITGAMALIMALHYGRDFRFIAGIPKAGEPFADALYEEYEMQVPGKTVLLHFDKKEDERGRHISNLVEQPDLSEGNRILLVDDLVTQADTKLEAIKAAEASGLEVARIIVVVDREQGGTEQLQEKGYELVSLLKLSRLLETYVVNGVITQEGADRVSDYLAANHM